MNQPARDHAPAPPPEHQTNYSLSEAAPGALLHEIRLRIRSLTQSQGLVFLALADLTHNRHGHGVSITTRDLCKTAGTSTATVSADLAELESRNLITVRRGHPNRYAVGWWNTIVVADPATRRRRFCDRNRRRRHANAPRARNVEFRFSPLDTNTRSSV